MHGYRHGTLDTYIGEDDAEVEVEVHYEWSPGEKRTWDYPGSAPQMEIFTVRRVSDGVDIVDTLTPNELDGLEEAAWAELDAEARGRAR